MIKRGLLLLLALTVLAGAGCSAKAKKAYHLKRADKYYAAGQYDRAEIEYLNVLSRDRQNAHAFGQLGQIYYDQGRLQRAAFFLNRGSQLATNDLNLRLKLGLVLSAARQLPQAREAAEFILAQQPTNDEAALLLVESTTKPEEAAAIRQQLLALPHAADRPGVQVALGNLYLHAQDLTNAGACYQRAQTLAPQSSLVNIALGGWYWLQKDLAHAETFYKAAAEASPARSPRRMQYARFKIETGDLTGGRKALEDILLKAPDYVPAQMALAEMTASEKKYAEAATLVAKILEQDPDGFDAVLLSAQLKLAQEQPGAAVQELERLTRLYPQAARAFYQLAAAYLANNNAADATTALRQAIKLEPNYLDAILMLAQIHIRTGNPQLVITLLEPLARQYPQLAQVQLLLADGYRMSDRVRDALSIYDRLEKIAPQNPQLPLLAGAAHQQLGENTQARKAYNQVLVLAPDNRIALEQLINLDILEKNTPAALQRINTELAKAPKEALLYLLQAKVFMAVTNAAQTETALLKAIELEPENQTPYLLLAQVYFDTKQSQPAIVKLDAVLAKHPDDISALMLKAIIYDAETNRTLAAETYEKLLKVSPRYSAAVNNLAYLYSVHLHKLDRAYELAKLARDLAPTAPATADTLGWVNYQKGSYSVALGLLKECATQLPAEPEVQYHYGMAAYMLNDEATAQAAFKRALQTEASFPGRAECQRCQAILAINPAQATAADQKLLTERIAEKADDVIALGRLAALYQVQGKPDQAIPTYEAILQANPNQVGAMISLISLYKDQQKAYDLARAAYKLTPDNPAVARLFGRLAYQAADFKLAASVLQQAAQTAPTDASILFDFAQALFSVGNLPQAQTTLQAVLAQNPAQAISANATRMLEMLNLAANPAQAVSAQPRIQEILKGTPNYFPAVLVQAVAAEQQSDLPRAQAAYESILKQYPDSFAAQKQLAAIYAKTASNLDQANALATKARTTAPNDPALIRTLGIVLAQQGDHNRALNFLKQSATGAYRNDPEVFFYLGTAQFQLKKTAESKTSLQQALALNLGGKQAETARQMLANLK